MALKGGEILSSYLTRTISSVSRAQTLRVGFFPQSVYPDGTPVAYAAVVNEFGYDPHNIPSRPFFRTMIANKSHEWPKDLAEALKINDYDSRKSLDSTGIKIEGQLRDSITQGGWVANAPDTRSHKGSDIPLIDTSLLINSVTREIS